MDYDEQMARAIAASIKSARKEQHAHKMALSASPSASATAKGGVKMPRNTSDNNKPQFNISGCWIIREDASPSPEHQTNEWRFQFEHTTGYMLFHGFQLDDKGKQKTPLKGGVKTTERYNRISWKTQDGGLWGGHLNSTGDRITNGEIFSGMGLSTTKFTGHLEREHTYTNFDDIKSALPQQVSSTTEHTYLPFGIETPEAASPQQTDASSAADHTYTPFDSDNSNVTGRWIIEMSSHGVPMGFPATYAFEQAPGQATFTGSRLIGNTPNRQVEGRVEGGTITWTEDREKKRRRTGRLNATCDRITEGQVYYRGTLSEQTFVGRLDRPQQPEASSAADHAYTPFDSRDPALSPIEMQVLRGTGGLLHAHGATLLVPPDAVGDSTLTLRRALEKEGKDFSLARAKGSKLPRKQLRLSSSVFELKQTTAVPNVDPIPFSKPCRLQVPHSSATRDGLKVLSGDSMDNLRQMSALHVEVKEKHVEVNLVQRFTRFFTVVKDTFAKLVHPQRVGVTAFAPAVVEPNTMFPLIVAFHRDRPECKEAVTRFMARRKPDPCCPCGEIKSMNVKKGSKITWKADGAIMKCDETEAWSDRDDFQHLELLWRLPDKGKEKDYAKLRVAVDGRSKGFVVSFRVGQAATTPTPAPLSSPVLKLLHRDRNMFECSWTDSTLRSSWGVEYVLYMCSLGNTRWHERRHGQQDNSSSSPTRIQRRSASSATSRQRTPPFSTGRKRLGTPPSVEITERPRTSPAGFAVPRTRSDKWLSLKNQWVQVWHGKARTAIVKAQIYAALLTVRRLLPNNDAVDDVSVSAVVEIPPLSEWAPITTLQIMRQTMRAQSPVNTYKSMDLSASLDWSFAPDSPKSPIRSKSMDLSPDKKPSLKTSVSTPAAITSHASTGVLESEFTAGTDHAVHSKTNAHAALVAVSTQLLRNLKTTTAYQMFGIKEPAEVEVASPATVHATALQAHFPAAGLDPTFPVYGAIILALRCLDSWANRVHAHHATALEMVASMGTLIDMRLDPSRSDCAPLLLALASTFEMLMVFAAPGWLGVFLDVGSDALFALHFAKVSKFFGLSSGLGSDCATLIPEPRPDKRVAMLREYTVSVILAMEGRSSSPKSPPIRRRISPIRLSPHSSRQRVAFITQLCMVFAPASETPTNAACMCSRDDMECEVEMVMKERRDLRHMFSLLMKDLGQKTTSVPDVEELVQRLEDAFRNKVDFNKNGMLDRSEISAFVAATSFQFDDSAKPQLSITQIRDNIFDAMATARGATGVNGVVMFGDVVVFMLKYCDGIPHSRWKQLLGLEAACSAAAPAPSAIPQHMILDRADVAVGAKIGVGSFGAVYKAKWHGEEVAAKIPHPVVSHAAVMTEAEVMTRVSNHQCILNFYGYIPAGKTDQLPMLLTRLMHRGSVHQVLVKDKQSVTLSQLVQMLRDVSAGLLHLHSQHPDPVCHRDMAARNLLVDENWRVCVADFGLSRALPKGLDHANHTRGAAFPLRWMAPESIKYHIYSTKSDMYMFAITMWEMLERELPFKSIPFENIGTHVWKGGRPTTRDPTKSTKSKSSRSATAKSAVFVRLYEIMRGCWCHEENARPSARDINHQLAQLVEQAGGVRNQTAIHNDIKLYHLFDQIGSVKS